MSELKPCPYSHIEKDYGHNVTVDYEEVSLPRVACSCGARGPVMATKEGAIAVWNALIEAAEWSNTE